MDIWMVYDREGRERNQEYVSLYRERCRKYRLNVRVVPDTEAARQVQAGERPLCVFVRTIQPELNRFFEDNGIPVFNSYEVSRICNHKGRTLEYLREDVLCVPSITLGQQSLPHMVSLDLEAVRHFFVQMFSYSSFVEQERAMIAQADDFVLKTVDGHGGREVYSLCREKHQIRKSFIGTPKSVERSPEYVLQPMIRSGKSYRDMRVYVVGTRIIAAVTRSSTDDFRANFSRGGEVRLTALAPLQKEAVCRVIGRFEFGMAGIDFLFTDDGQMVLNEIEDVAGARMLYECAPEIDIVGEYLRYVLEEKLNYRQEDVR